MVFVQRQTLFLLWPVRADMPGPTQRWINCGLCIHCNCRLWKRSKAAVCADLGGQWGFGMQSRSWSSSTTCTLRIISACGAVREKNLQRSAFLFTPHHAWAGRISVLLWPRDISCACFRDGIWSCLQLRVPLSKTWFKANKKEVFKLPISTAEIQLQTRIHMGQMAF